MTQCENCCFYDDKENLCINENAMFNIDDECLSRIDNEDYNAIYNKALDDFVFQIHKNQTILCNDNGVTNYHEYAISISKCDKIAEQLKGGMKNDD